MSDALSIPDSQLLSLQELASAPSSASEQFLRLHLPEMTVLLPVQHLTEVLTIPIGQIVPIPHMPAWVMGVYNWRGEVLWMVDLGHLCGLIPWYQQPTSISTHSAVVLQVREPQIHEQQIREQRATSTSVKSQTLGLVVSQIEDMEWCDPDVIQSLPLATLTPEIAPFLRGYWWKSNDDMLAVLDGQAILEAMPKS